MRRSIIGVVAERIPQQRYRLFDFAGVHEQIGQKYLRLRLLRVKGQCTLVGCLRPAILFATTKLEGCVRRIRLS